MKKKAEILFLFWFICLGHLCSVQANELKMNDNNRIIVAYVTSWSSVLPDPHSMTHINYAFGHVNDTYDGIRIDNPQRLRAIVALKKENPDLKVALSIGGWGSGRFSEMAASKKNRKKFAKDCHKIIKEFDLDGVDIDWEYPTSTAADISASPQDTENYTLLMSDIRKAIGKNKLLTLASIATADYVNFPAIVPLVDFVNIMAYDMGVPPFHHSALFRSGHTGYMTADEAVTAHLEAGIPLHKLVLGVPFYGRGTNNIGSFIDYKKIEKLEGVTEWWDEAAQVPFLVDKEGDFICTFENKRSLGIKCRYIIDKGLLGGMYWDYDGDNENGDLRNTLNFLLRNRGENTQTPDFKVLVLTERGGQHGSFTDTALEWLTQKAKQMNFVFTEINNTKPITENFLKEYNLFIQLDFPPYTWSEEAEKAFIDYIDEGKGGWIGFHHATLLGDFDGYPLWKWFSDFMGGIRFKNYIAETASGKVCIEDVKHPIMAGLPTTFTIPDDEWYTFDRSPRPHVRVLANVDESTYEPTSSIQMGDHPVIWVNEDKKARNVYFLFGHSGVLFEINEFNTLFTNAIRWASQR